MRLSKKNVLTILTLTVSAVIVFGFYYVYILGGQSNENNTAWFMLFLFITSLVYIYIMYRMVLIYNLKNKTFSFTFYLINEQKEEVIDKAFIVYPLIGNKALLEGEDFFKPISGKTGKVSINDLPGGTYRLAFRDKPRDILGIFGVKRSNQKKMIWYKTMTNKVRVRKKRRLWIIINEEFI